MKHRPKYRVDRDHWDASCDTPRCTWSAVNLTSEERAQELVAEHAKLVEQPATPELDKQLEIIHSGKAEIVQDFYDWLTAQGYVLAKWDGDPYDCLIPVRVDPEKLMADHFGIDRDKIEQERRAILEAIREQQG